MSLLAAISYNPIVRIHIGPLSISPHGIGIAVGFLIGARFMLPRSQKKGIPDDLVYPLFTLAAIGAIVGARVAYVLNHFSDYTSVWDALQVWKGGISLLGGFVGAILFAVPKIRKTRLSFWKVMDAAAPGMALGVTIGRIGDLVVGDHLGKTTSFFLGYKCPPLGVQTASPCAPTPFSARTPGAVVHQTALYDLIFAGILLVVLLVVEKRERFDGFMTCMFGIGYGFARIVEDFLREDLRRFGLTGSQWVAILTVVLCLYVLLVRRRTPAWGHWDERRDEPLGESPDEPPDGPPAGPPDEGRSPPTVDEEAPESEETETT